MCVVLKRKADFRKGWSKRLDFAVLRLVRVFLGTSRLMVVHFERFAELKIPDKYEKQTDGGET